MMLDVTHLKVQVPYVQILKHTPKSSVVVSMFALKYLNFARSLLRRFCKGNWI